MQVKEESNVIADNAIGILRDAIKKYAIENKGQEVEPKDVQIIIAVRPQLDDKNQPTGQFIPFYRVFKHMQPALRVRKIKDYPFQEETDEVTFKQMLGIKFDPLNKEERVSLFMLEAFARFQGQLSDEATNQAKDQAEAKIKALEAKAAETGATVNPEDIKNLRNIDEIVIDIEDIEIFIVTAKNDPVTPIPLLYVAGEQVRQLKFVPDIFQLG